MQAQTQRQKASKASPCFFFFPSSTPISETQQGHGDTPTRLLFSAKLPMYVPAA